MCIKFRANCEIKLCDLLFVFFSRIIPFRIEIWQVAVAWVSRKTSSFAINQWVPYLDLSWNVLSQFSPYTLSSLQTLSQNQVVLDPKNESIAFWHGRKSIRATNCTMNFCNNLFIFYKINKNSTYLHFIHKWLYLKCFFIFWTYRFVQIESLRCCLFIFYQLTFKIGKIFWKKY